MSHKFKRTGTVGLGIALIASGAQTLQSGAQHEGLALLASGILVIYGYHIIEDMGIEEVSEDILENLEIIEEATGEDESE